MAANAKTRPPLYNKNNEIVVKLNDNASAEEMKKQAPEEVAHRISGTLGIPITKIDLEKVEETKEKIATQNASMCAGMKIESIFWLSASKKDRRTSSLVVEVVDAKRANMLIEEGLVLDYTNV